KSGITQLGIVQPDDSIGVPNSMIAKGNFVLKPANNNDYEWSQSISETSILELMSRSNTAKIIDCPSSNPMETTGKAFYCILYLKMEDSIQYKQRATLKDVFKFGEQDLVFELRPPIAIENLLGCPIEYYLYDKPNLRALKMEIAKGQLERGEKI